MFHPGASGPGDFADSRSAVRRGARGNHRARRRATGDGSLNMAPSANLPPAKTAQDLSPAAPGVHHETSDASVGAVFAFGLALIIAGVIILFVVWLLFGYFKGREAGSGVPEF